MDLAPHLVALALLAGALAGIINTLAGSGSLVTLPLLIFLGLPADVANGTNRVGILLQNVVGLRTLHRRGLVPLEGSRWVVLSTMAGAAVGAGVAVVLGAERIQQAITAVMVIMLFVLLVRPEHWLRAQPDREAGRPRASMVLVFFAVGAYGGFIQAGVGTLLLAALVLGAGHTLIGGNALKLVIALLFTLVALPIFVLGGQVHWGFGLLMALGQGAGGYLGANFLVRVPRAEVWVHRLLIAMVAFSVMELTGLRVALFR